MASIRAGSKVCMIMAMNVKGTVLEIFEREHKSMLTAGPLTKSWWAKVQVVKPSPGTPSVIECRLGDLMNDD